MKAKNNNASIINWKMPIWRVRIKTASEAKLTGGTPDMRKRSPIMGYVQALSVLRYLETI